MKMVTEPANIESHLQIKNNYINWLLKVKKSFVILRQFKNKENFIKMYVVLPVREREFTSTTMNIFKKEMLNNKDFPIDIEKIKEYETIYSGNMDDFRNFYKYLNTFTFIKRIRPIGFLRKTTESILLYKDYTKTKKQQENDFVLVNSFTTPHMSIASIFRLIQTKYITIVSITFNS